MIGLFSVAAPWPVKRLDDLCEGGNGSIQTGPFGSQLHASDYVSDGIPCVMPQDKRIAELDVAIAPKGVHAAFAEIVSPMFDRVLAVGQESRNLAALRDTLLPRLMSGDLRIRDAEKEIEEFV